jgi:hypothetical protein
MPSPRRERDQFSVQAIVLLGEVNRCRKVLGHVADSKWSRVAHGCDLVFFFKACRRYVRRSGGRRLVGTNPNIVTAAALPRQLSLKFETFGTAPALVEENDAMAVVGHRSIPVSWSSASVPHSTTRAASLARCSCARPRPVKRSQSSPAWDGKLDMTAAGSPSSLAVSGRHLRSFCRRGPGAKIPSATKKVRDQGLRLGVGTDPTPSPRPTRLVSACC